MRIVKPLSDFRIYVEVEDGRKGVFDLKPYLAGCCKTITLADTSSKSSSKCSFTLCKLRFFATFFLVSTALTTFFSSLLDHGVFRELSDVHYFNQVGILFGAVTWPNEQDIAPETLIDEMLPV